MKAGTRRAALFGVLALVVAAALWPGDDAATVGAPHLRKPRVDPTAHAVASMPGGALDTSSPGQLTVGLGASATAPSLALERLARLSEPMGENNPFAAKSWIVAPPAPVAAVVVAAPAPVAPPLPFSYAGKLEVEGGRWIYYLARGDQSFAVSKGDVFDGVYRFDGVDQGSLVIFYLPLSTIQKLPINIDS